MRASKNSPYLRSFEERRRDYFRDREALRRKTRRIVRSIKNQTRNSYV